MESGDVFYSRFYRNRVTYLSRALYAALKPHRRRIDRLTEESRCLLTFLQAAGKANAEEMRAACRLDKKAQVKALDQLIYELFVTVIQRDRTIRENWCTFSYGPAERWEEKKPFSPGDADFYEAEQRLSRQLTKSHILKILS